MSKTNRNYRINSRTFQTHIDCGDLGEREAEITYSFSPADSSVGQSESIDVEDVLIRFGPELWISVERDEVVKKNISLHCEEDIDAFTKDFEKRIDNYFFDKSAAA